MKKMQSLQSAAILSFVLGAGMLWGGSQAFAAELEEFTLDPMVVTAQKMETRDLDTPASTTVITQKDIQEKGYTSVFDALEQTIGVTSYSYSPSGDDLGGSLSRFYIRGLDKGTLVLVNGAPINIMNYSSTEGIPVEAIEKIEIVKGSNSVLYGAEAMGGVVNIITKHGGESKTTVSGLAGNYKKKYGISISEKDFFASFNRDYDDEFYPTNRLFSKSSSAWKNAKGYKNSLYLSGRLNDKLTFDWSHVESDRNRYAMGVVNGAPTGLIKSSGKGKYEYDARRDNANLVYNDKENLFKSVLAYNTRRLDSTYISYNKDQSFKKSERGTNYTVYGLTFDNQKTWKLNSDKDSWTNGVTFKREHYEELANTDNSIGRTAYSVYSSYSHQFAPKLTGILGVRGEFSRDNGWDKEHNVFLPQLQFLYKATDNWSLYTNVGKSFDMPAINSKYYLDDQKIWSVEPQEGWTYEVGSKYIDDKDSLKIALFHMDIDNKFEWVTEDQIIPGGSDDINVQINGGKFRNTGLEVEYVHLVDDNWKYNLGLTIANPEIKPEYKSKYIPEGKWRQESAKLQANAGVNYNKDKFSGGVNFFLTGQREDAYYNNLGLSFKKNGGETHAVPNRAVLNANFQYRPDKNQSFSLNFYNLLDRDNCINENENYDLPFNWTIGYSYSF